MALDAALLAEAKSLQLNGTHAAQADLQPAMAEKRVQLWLQANQVALDSSYAHGDQHGLPLLHWHF